jgi:hypothetical protein
VEEADMKIEPTQRFCGALLGVAGLLLSATATADWWGGHHKKQNDACYQTTRSMKSACQADAIDDFYVEIAKCLNTDEVRSCKYEVREEFNDALVECREQSEGRNDLCDRRLGGRGPRACQVPLELPLEELDLRAGKLVQGLEIVVGADPRVRDDEDAVLHVVEGEHRVEQHEAGLIGAVSGLAKVTENRLEP